MPCGTTAALRRHRRRGERPCEACLEAGRVATREAREVAHRAWLERFHARLAAMPRDTGPLDVAADTRENWRLVCEAMDAAPAESMPGLSRQREALVDKLVRLERDDQAPAKRLLAELEARREQRRAEAARRAVDQGERS